LWPDDTVVVFDDNLNTAVRKLRAALGDTAKHSRFVETLPRRGYRFVADTRTKRLPTEDSPPRIAVLPLDNLSGDPEQEYFADGMTDAIITDLAKLGAMSVISRTSIIQYKGVRKPLGEIANDTLKNDFRSIRPSDASILLVEGVDRVLPPYPPPLSAVARTSLESLGVTVRTGTSVTRLDDESVTLRSDGEEERIDARTVLWAAGVQANDLGKDLASACGATLDRGGRLVVDPDLSLPGHPEILVIGDMAHFVHQGDQPLPAVAPVAMAQGRYVANLIRQRLQKRPTKPFHYIDKGSMATIGRSKAVCDFGWLRFSGLLAWLTWLFVHLLFLVEFQNRLLVLVQWAWNYTTFNRGARLITGKNPLPLSLSSTKEGTKRQVVR